jgi:hypothetical protein
MSSSLHFFSDNVGDRICAIKMELIEHYQRRRTLELIADYEHAEEYGYLGNQIMVS